ncbi:MAG TPA: hypothetical protein DHV28_18695 [Ignavibacteriales bacterium]|nr:hypothetical protein [Ignavibacteriales bacterium]
MNPKYFLSLSLVFLILSFSFSEATVRFVSKSGTSTPPYTSWQTAADSIRKCINVCNFGDTIYVANGIYKERIDMIPGLTLIGAGMDSCIIDTRQLSTPYYSMRTYDGCYVKGFGIYCRNASEGWGVYILNSTMEFCKIQEASLGIDAGTSQNESTHIYKNIVNNVWNGIVCEGKPVISENIISALITALTSQINSSPTYYNNIINGNNSDVGFYDALGFVSKLNSNQFVGSGNYTFWSYGNDSITNNIVYGTDGNWGVGMIGAGSKATNNHFQNNNTVLYYDQPGGSPQILKYNNLWENGLNAIYTTIDSTNIFNNPMFVNADSMDFHLQKYSPLIDAGDPNILDKDGSRSDIGIYGGPFGESYKYLDLAPRAPINLTAVVDTNTISLFWNRNTEADTSFYKVYRDTVINFTIDSTKLISSSADTSFIELNPHNVTKYVYKVTCVDKQGNESEPSTEVVVNITGVENYPQLISDYQLYQNYPNPFNPNTIISYRLKERGYVKLYVYDIKGELISVLVNRDQEAGFYQVEFPSIGNGLPTVPNNSNLASGIYIYQIMIRSERDIPVFTEMKKMVYLK